MSILERILDLEMRSLGGVSKRTSLVVTAALSIGFVFLSMEIENKSFVCILAGLLIFWERYLVVRLRDFYGNGSAERK